MNFQTIFPLEMLAACLAVLSAALLIGYTVDWYERRRKRP